MKYLAERIFGRDHRLGSRRERSNCQENASGERTSDLIRRVVKRGLDAGAHQAEVCSPGGSGTPMVACRFEDSRSGDCVARHLDGYRGILQIDGHTFETPPLGTRRDSERDALNSSDDDSCTRCSEMSG